MKKATRALVNGLMMASLLPFAAWAGPVDVNSADAATLAEELDGVGPAKAQAIVEFREQYGAFKSADELLEVKGIGERVLDLNRDNIRIDGRAAKPLAGK